MLPSVDSSDTDVHVVVHGNTFSAVNRIFSIWRNLEVTNMDLDISIGSRLMERILLKAAHCLRELHIRRFRESNSVDYSPIDYFQLLTIFFLVQ